MQISNADAAMPQSQPTDGINQHRVGSKQGSGFGRCFSLCPPLVQRAACSTQLPYSNLKQVLLSAEPQPVVSAHCLPQLTDTQSAAGNRNVAATPAPHSLMLGSSKHIHTPGTNSIIHTRGIAVDHTLPLEGPAVDQSHLVFCPPGRQEKDSNTKPKPASKERQKEAHQCKSRPIHTP